MKIKLIDIILICTFLVALASLAISFSQAEESNMNNNICIGTVVGNDCEVTE